jgi:colanic acid/amylovoran biosynthesis glycosyltransferase
MPGVTLSNSSPGDSLLLDLGVPFRVANGKIHVEAQAHNGLLRWLDNFARITVCAPVLPDGHTESSMRWTAADTLLAGGRLTVEPFPWSYDIAAHIRNADTVRRKLRTLIPQHRYLCFSNLGWLGAWGRIAAEEAFRQGRPYSVWLDWVLHAMPRAPQPNPLKRGWRALQGTMLKHTSLRDIRRAKLGLFHGKTVFDAYAGLSKVSRVVHDVHLGEQDVIPEQLLEKRLAGRTGPLKILYVGRVDPMKGPREWLDTMERVLAQTKGQLDVRAEWVGDGPLLTELRATVRARNLADHISFPGAEMDRQKILEIFRSADVFAFCHLTPESPRCLIEALMSGLPILGFESAYAADLLHGSQGGTLVPTSDTAALAAATVTCLSDRAVLRRMAQAARRCGTNFSDVAVFRHRSDLIKEFL